MSVRSDLPIEIAMTHRAGGGGVTERVLRPPSVRELAQRVQKWAVQLETCQSCQSRPASRCVEGRALCVRCHGHRAERMGRVLEVALPITVTRADDAEPARERLDGYAIRFNERSVELWGFYEYIRPAAADRMVAERPDLRMLWNHDSSEPLGRVSAGTLRASKRSAGVWIENDPPRWAGRHIESIQRRDVSGMSFGFIALEDDWWLEDGIPQREVLDMDVVEVSAVAFPAYPTTSIKAVSVGERHREAQTAERLRLAAL